MLCYRKLSPKLRLWMQRLVYKGQFWSIEIRPSIPPMKKKLIIVKRNFIDDTSLCFCAFAL